MRVAAGNGQLKQDGARTMRGELRNTRDAAVALHDAAVSRHTPNFDAAFAAAMSEVIERLERVITDAERDPSADPVEVSKTCRWLGDAWFDHSRHARRPSWERGAEAYLKAERLLAGRIAPVEQATLDFNFGNTLRALSEGTDVGLLEAAEVRYERAAKAFRDSHLSNFATMVSTQLGDLRPQLRLARERAVMQGNYKRMEMLLTRFPAASKIEHAEIAGEIVRTVGSLNRDALAAAAGEAVAALTGAARSVPGMEPQLAKLGGARGRPQASARRRAEAPGCRKRRDRSHHRDGRGRGHPAPRSHRAGGQGRYRHGRSGGAADATP